jgi:RNA recognition motif-containing protein
MAIREILLIFLWSSSLTEGWMSTKNARRSQPLPRTSTVLMAVMGERKFAQPNKNARSFKGDGKLAEMYEQRVKTAGRVGTKRFVDPCKVFVGNLPFTMGEKELKLFILTIMGQTTLVLQSVKIIRDWKTGKSKGFAFCIFSDPIYATVCMEGLNGKMLEGRALSVSGGKKKDQESLIYVKKEKKIPVDDEEAAIVSGLELAESEDEDGIPSFGVSNEDIELDAKLFGLAGDDDDDDVDGIYLEGEHEYEGEIDPNLNRSQRREAQKLLKKKKKPHKGFGKPS